jgi:S1-C subfamily serine protease
MKHTKLMSAPAALFAALAFGAGLPAAFAAQPNAAAEATPNQEQLQKKLDEARAQLDKSAREVAELSMQLGGDGRRDFFLQRGGEGPPPRAIIGVQIANGANEGGAKVLEVSPGGPAAEAGIKAGDLITSIGGQVIAAEADPGRALVARMAQIDPNLKVSVGVMRDGKALALDVTPRPAPVQNFRFERRGPGDGPGAQVFNFPGPGPGPGPGRGVGPGAGPGLPGLPGMGGPFQQRREIIINRGDEGGMGTRFHGIEFATLSEKLGSYFGVKSGVLVVRAGNNAAFKLQDGDVILAIDGRTPSSAQHAGRILRSYSPGEKLAIRVQRDRKAQNLEVTVPGGGED